jgi:PAS domain S-box-containing protein
VSEPIISTELTELAESEPPLKAKILIVDDDPRNALALTTVLEDLGQTLVVAYSGEEALKHLLYDEFAVILLDLHMPGMDGYETAALIRGRQRSRHIPIVFQTAMFREDSHLLQAYSAGAVDMIFKPIDPFILKSKVAVFVDLYLGRAKIRREAELRHRLQEENFRVRTEKLMAEKALRQSEENYRLIVEGVSDYAIFMLDPEGAVASWNPGAQRIKQYSAGEIIGEHFSRFYTPEEVQRGVPERALRTAAAEGRYEAEGLRVRKDGTQFWANVVLDAIRDERGNLLGFAKITRDITERRELEQQLVQAQKMETVGQLTGGIAHDFNNLLTVILGNLDLVTRQVGDNDRLRRHLAAIRHASERGHALTRQLLAFSRRQHLTPEVLDVGALFRGFEQLLRRAVGDSVTLEIEVPDEEIVCEVDPNQLENAVLNLAMNARDAVQTGGQIAISVRRVELAPELCARNAESSPGPWVVITVSDQGTGMSAAVRERAFEPFFTTKETGRGSGLGLSQVYGFVRQSGGFVTLDSEVGQGTRISIYLLPSSKPLAAPQAAPDRGAPVMGMAEYVLLVEDDPNVLALGIEMLTELGYRVKTASDGAGALELLRRDGPIDLLFTDVVMPGGYTGVQLALEARKLRPGIKVLLTSGYTGEALARHQTDRADLPLIEKPYRQADLAAKLREVLQKRSEAA